MKPPAAEAAPAAPPETAAVRQSAVRRFFAELGEGTRFVADSPVLRVLLVTLAVLTLGAATLNTLNVFFVSEKGPGATRLADAAVADETVGAD